MGKEACGSSIRVKYTKSTFLKLTSYCVFDVMLIEAHVKDLPYKRGDRFRSLY